MACLNMRHELLALPEFALYDKFPKLFRFTKASTGGHNGGFEVPALLAQDIIDSFNQCETILEKSNQSKKQNKSV